MFFSVVVDAVKELKRGISGMRSGGAESGVVVVVEGCWLKKWGIERVSYRG